MQLGVCGFKYDQKKLTCYPYNFYIYPFDHPAYQSTFLTSVGSFDFLSKHNFDFNKWVYEGVGFLAKGEFEKYEERRREAIVSGEGEEFKNADFFTSDTIIYCNSKFIEIRDWVKECEATGDFTKELKVDLTLTPYKYFNTLMRKLPR